MSLAAATLLLTDALLGLQHTTRQTERKPEFRMSSLPYCPLRFLEKERSPHEEKYTSDFYFETGTAHHNLWQKWLAISRPLQPHMWGDWRCRKCGHAGPRRSCHPTRGCRRCGGNDWGYVEIELNWDGLTGHVDTILRLRNKGKKGKHKHCYVVVDYKSSFMDVSTDRSKYPLPVNLEQIQGYCAALKESMGVNVEGWILAYIDRRRPLTSASALCIRTGVWTPAHHKAKLASVARAKKAHASVLAYEARPTPSGLKRVIACRPCTTRAEFTTRMEAAFTFEDSKKCPHLAQCTGKNRTDASRLAYFGAHLAELEKAQSKLNG